MSENRLGNNIRALRIAYGETLEALGEYLHVGKTAVANYESGSREVDQEKLASLAKHFMVSTEELLNGDFSDIGKIVVDRTVFLKELDTIFPIVSTQMAMKNKHFARAYKKHVEFYENAKKGSFEKIDNIGICLEEYCDAYEDDECVEEAAVNLLACWVFMMMSINVSSVLPNNTSAAFMQLSKRDPHFKKELERIEPGFENDMKDATEAMNNPEAEEYFAEILKKVKNSTKWNDLAYYYLALKYMYSVDNTNIQWETRRMIGAEMLGALLDLDNVYAARFLKLSLDSIGQGSRIVNKKQ